MPEARNIEQVTRDAEAIAKIVAATHTDDRHVLYLQISLNLRETAQNYSARLFQWISDKDRNG